MSYLVPRQGDVGGYRLVSDSVQAWAPTASLETIAAAFEGLPQRLLAGIDRQLADPQTPGADRLQAFCARASLLNYVGQPQKACATLADARRFLERTPALAREWLYTLVLYQGVSALRLGENENCVLCLGEGACTLPISAKAIHTNQEGSRQALRHFTDFLEQFPDNAEVRWLLNLAAMTLGEHPSAVDARFRISLEPFLKSEFDIGHFHDIAHRVGLDRMNMAGGAVMDDFDNDGNLDLMVTTWDASKPMAYYRNKGDGTFEDRTAAAGLSKQLGGLNCVQADYNNDGHLDLFIIRGAWVQLPMRPSLLRNNGDGTFTDVTREAGLLDGVTSNSACWADYDNDGFVDLFICCETQPNKLYHNNGDGTFTEVAGPAGLAGYGGVYKGATWIDYDNDGLPDLFVNRLDGSAELYHNNGDGTFTNVTEEMGIDGPEFGFACWAFDYDNDGWLDIFATCYDRTVGDVVKGMLGQPHKLASNRLFKNIGGKGFQDVTKEVGLDRVFATMGCNFGDFDNDGYLDFYLGTGDPSIATLVPNRMFKNVAGKRFAEITTSAGTGNLQKGHGVACGDWDNDGHIDLFIQMGGAIPGDPFRNILFQNPAQSANGWLSVKLIGKKTNRAALGARLKAVTSTGQTLHRHVSSGSSFGANPLQQHLGLGKADRVTRLEIHWPTSKSTQVFQDIPAGQHIQITEFENDYRKIDKKRIVPSSS